MNIDIIYNQDCIPGMHEKVRDESIDLVIADPPYFKIAKEKWDYIWRTEQEYLTWSEKWISEVSRVMRKGGSLYVFGYIRMLSFLLPVIESFGFKFKQQIILSKGIQSVSGRATKNYKMFPNTVESVMFFYKDPRPYIKDILLSQQKLSGLKAKDINERLGVKSNGGGMWSIYTGNNICEQVPTKEIWEQLQKILDFTMPYESITQTFNAQMGFTDIWEMKTYNIKNRIHPTQKPYEIINRMILASSNSGDVVLDPFSGSGTTALSCKNNGRHYIGFEIDENYYKSSLQFINA